MTEVELKQQQQPPVMASGQFSYGPFRNVPPIDPTMYGQPPNPAGAGVMPSSSSTALVPYQQQLRSPSLYFPSNPTQPPPPGMARSSGPRSPNVPNILIENSNNLNSTTASNPDNETIYNEHTLHPPSLPSLPSNELQCLPLQPRSHSADNYTHYQQHQQHFDPRFGHHRYPPPPFFAGSKYDRKYEGKYDDKYEGKYDAKYDAKYDPRQHPTSKSFLDFNQRLPSFHRADYYSSLPFHHPAYRAAYGHSPLDGDPHYFAAPHPFAFSNLSAANYGHAFANPSYHPSMSFANKFTHHYPYSPAFFNSSFYPHYPPFLCYPDYANAKFRQPVSELR